MNYSSDSPISDENDNLFSGRKEYAKKIAEAICSLDRDQSFVIGLYSSWGYGKTSLINMIKVNLDEKNKLKKNNEQKIYYLDLEPWSFIRAKSMVSKIYYEINKVICADKTNIHDLSVKLRVQRFLKVHKDKLFSFIIDKKDTIDFSLKELSSLEKEIKPLVNILTKIGSGSIKKIFEKYLNKSQEIDKIVVFIDDIDRLNPDEILNVFKIIKSVANIKGVIFFLAFDYDIVVKALEMNRNNPDDGKKYIEKIIQIPLELSRIKQEELLNYFENGLLRILEENNILLNREDEQWTDFLIIYGIAKYKIDTPRTVNRILNGMVFMLPILKNVVNIYDALSMELIRTLYVDLYDKIWKNKSLLTGYNYIPESLDVDEEKKHKINETFKDKNELNILKCLFPFVAKTCFNHNALQNERLDRVKKRICSPAYFDRYFTYSKDKDDISDNEFYALIGSSSPSVDQIKYFMKNPHQCDIFLTMLRDNRDDIADKYNLVVALIFALETVDWAYSEDGRMYAPIYNAFNVASSILSGKDMNSSKNLDALLNISENCKRLETLSYLIRRVYFDNDSRKDNDKITLNEHDYRMFKAKIVQLIHKLINDKTIPLYGNDIIVRELYKYYVWFENDNALINNYMKAGVKNEDNATDFISQFLSRVVDINASIKYWEDLLYDDSEQYRTWFMGIFDAKYLYDIISQSKKYSKYKGLNIDEIQRFDNIGNMLNKHDAINKVGNEHATEFREIIASQFMYCYENIEAKPR